jgi:hypothetical protein
MVYAGGIPAYQLPGTNKAIINALKAWIPFIKGSQVMVATDNTSVVA